jgi:antitoxin component of MazEF toxin-antitoxin module
MAQIEERTVSRVGSGSLMVTLPRGWLRFHHLKAGDKVDVISGRDLRIRVRRGPRLRFRRETVPAGAKGQTAGGQ